MNLVRGQEGCGGVSLKPEGSGRAQREVTVPREEAPESWFREEDG